MAIEAAVLVEATAGVELEAAVLVEPTASSGAAAFVASNATTASCALIAMSVGYPGTMNGEAPLLEPSVSSIACDTYWKEPLCHGSRSNVGDTQNMLATCYTRTRIVAS